MHSRRPSGASARLPGRSPSPTSPHSAGLVHPTIYGGIDRKRFIIETNGVGRRAGRLDSDGWLDALVLSGTRLEGWHASGDNLRRCGADEPPVSESSRRHASRMSPTEPDCGEPAGRPVSAPATTTTTAGIDLFVTVLRHECALSQSLVTAGSRTSPSGAGLADDGVRWGSGCTFVDFDRDGRLDLFVANYLHFDLAPRPSRAPAPNCLWKGIPVNCGPKGLPTDTNLLYHNDGDGTFADVSDASGIARVTGRYSMTAVAADFDGDGWPDIYVASDSTAAILYRNNRDGTFTDVAVESGAAYSEHGSPQAGMGVAVGDYNARRPARSPQDAFRRRHSGALSQPRQGPLRGRGRRRRGCACRTATSSGAPGCPTSTTTAAPDLFYVTGNVYPEIERAAAAVSAPGARASCSAIPAAAASRTSRRAAARGCDAALEPRRRLRRLRQRRRHRRARDEHERAAVAAAQRLRAAATAGSRSRSRARLEPLGDRRDRHRDGRQAARRRRAVLSQSSYYSHDDLRLHFGLGAASRVDEIEVRWPNGQVQD